MDTLTVRPVRESDAPALGALLNDIIARGGTTALQRPFTPDGLAEAMLIGPAVFCCFAAEDATGTLLGFQALTRASAEAEAEIGTFVRLGAVQKGIGSRLFAATRRAAATGGLHSILATIRADNAGGLTFYDRQGFTDVGRHSAVPLDDGTPVDRVDKRYLVEPG